MRIIPALIGASLGVGIATTVIAQTTTPPAPAINPGTKVYAYEKKASPKAKMTSPMQQRIDDEAPIGSQKWWIDQNRRSLGNSGDGGGSGM